MSNDSTNAPVKGQACQNLDKPVDDIAQRELLFFEVFSKYAVLSFLRSEIETIDPIRSVRLYVNPTQIQFNQPRIVQKVQTQTYQRFVIQDWGTDLLTLAITGQTGKLLPVQRGKTILETLQDIKAEKEGAPDDKEGAANPPEGNRLGRLLYRAPRQADTPYSVMESLKYSDIIGQSDAFTAFQSLFFLYKDFNATTEVMKLTYGPRMYRGYFSDFSYTQDATKPWNWQYTASFVVLSELTTNQIRVTSGQTAIEHDDNAVIAATSGDL